MQYLRNGWSYRDGLVLILTAMPTFLWGLQMLKRKESNINPKIANFCKKMAENGLIQEKFIISYLETAEFCKQ